MKKLVLATAGLLPLFLTACPSNSEVCKLGVEQLCERSHECQPQSVKDTPQFQAVFGTSVEECKNILEANPLLVAGGTGLACDQVETEAQLCQDLGYATQTNFDLRNAIACRDWRADMTCTQYLNQLANPALAPV